MDTLGSLLNSLLPSAIALVVVVLVLSGANRFLRGHMRRSTGFEFRRPLIMLSLTLLGLVAVIINLPIDDPTQEELLRLLGLLLSAAIALSATTFLSNAMGGLMLRSVSNFKIGDFIRVDDQFGRVTERGLFHTEIQTEDRDLITLPNMLLVTSAVRHVRSSGTIVSATVSLGYDVRHDRIETCLIEAATNAGLEDPFVQVKQLGDFSVTYRIAGLLVEVKQLLTVRSELRKCVMDTLHAAQIEIVSPTVMTTRALREEAVILPASGGAPPAPTAASDSEGVVFDKADEAEQLEHRRDRHKQLSEELTKAREQRDAAAPGAEREQLETRLARLEKIEGTLGSEVASREDLLERLDDE